MSSPLIESSSEEVVCASSAADSQLVSHFNTRPIYSASYKSFVQGTQCAEEVGILQGRVAREPVDRSRYVVINSNSGTIFACSRCCKQYIHRKSLNKHWNDKHIDGGVDAGKYLAYRPYPVSEPHKNVFTATQVHCPSASQQTAHSCNSSLIRSAIQSYAVSSQARSVVPVVNSQQKVYSGQHESQTKHTGTVRDSVLWHSLAAIHLNQEQDLNSFYCAPMPAHSGGRYSDRGSFASLQMFCDDDCQVLDLSKRSSSVHEKSRISFPADVPLDLSLKSDTGSLCLADSDLSMHGTPETDSKSTTRCKEISAVTPRLNKCKRANWLAGKTGDSMKDIKFVQSDSVSMLRRLHSGISADAKTDQPIVEDSDSCKAASSLGENNVEGEPSAKCDEHYPNPDSVHFKNNLKVIKITSDLATAEETHYFFGGISRGGHIRCKKCDFSATSMLLFSQHVARHVRQPSSGTCNGAQSQCGDDTDELENVFFTWLGLHRNNGVVSDQKSSVGCHYSEADSLYRENSNTRCNAVVSDGSECSMAKIRANGFGSDHVGESGLQKNNRSSDSVRQKPGIYRRGWGLTTTESRDATGRSWRRRRLRTCERCGYVTDNLTTLKRHEEKHGAQGMYRCKLCDYTVNQQHILEYHTRNVHGQLRQTCAGNLTTLVGGGKEKKVSASNSHVVKGHGTHGMQNALNKCQITNKIVTYPASVSVARRHMLDAFGLQLGRGICIRCGFRSLSIVRMKLHMLRHPDEQYACSQCPHTSMTARLLSKHKIVHTDCDNGNLAQKKTYLCPECPFTAASPHRLQCHTQFHGAKFRHVCDRCSYSVDRANLMAQHRRLHAFTSTLTGPKQHRLHCSKCPFKTINRVSIVNHERGHYATNCRYMCHLCSFGTDVTNVALGHQRLHSCGN